MFQIIETQVGPIPGRKKVINTNTVPDKKSAAAGLEHIVNSYRKTGIFEITPLETGGYRCRQKWGVPVVGKKYPTEVLITIKDNRTSEVLSEQEG